MRANQCGVFRIYDQARFACGFGHLVQSQFHDREDSLRMHGEFASHHLPRHVQRQIEHHVCESKIQIVQRAGVTVGQFLDACAFLRGFRAACLHAFRVTFRDRLLARREQGGLCVGQGIARVAGKLHHFPALKRGRLLVGRVGAAHSVASSGRLTAPSAARCCNNSAASSCAV